eukprot:755161-Prorocentrum_minimum.AAC.1
MARRTLVFSRWQDARSRRDREPLRSPAEGLDGVPRALADRVRGGRAVPPIQPHLEEARPRAGLRLNQPRRRLHRADRRRAVHPERERLLQDAPGPQANAGPVNIVPSTAGALSHYPSNNRNR